jgi:hypothetical protein
MSVTATLPVVTRIEVELFDRLQKLAAGWSDYTYVSEVIRPKRLSGYTPKDRQVVLTRGFEERIEVKGWAKGIGTHRARNGKAWKVSAVDSCRCNR